MQSESFLLRLLVAAVAAVDVAVLEYGRADFEPLAIVPIALVTAQLTLLCVWMTHGTSPLLQRAAIGLAGLIALRLAFAEYRSGFLPFALGVFVLLLLLRLAEQASARRSGTNLGRWQFSLGTLMLVVLLAAAGMAFWQQYRLRNYLSPPLAVVLVPAQILVALSCVLAMLGRYSLLRFAMPLVVAAGGAWIIARMSVVPHWGWYAGMQLTASAVLTLTGLVVLRVAHVRVPASLAAGWQPAPTLPPEAPA